MIKNIALCWTIRILFIVFFIAGIFLFLVSPKFLVPLSKRKSINVFAWTNMIDEKVIAQFREKTGVDVLVKYYENQDELFLKLRTGSEDECDVIFTSDYLIPLLIDGGHVKKINKKRFLKFHLISPELCNRYYDPNNEYTIPYEWAVFGLGINKTLVKESEIEKSWKSVFDVPLPYKVGVLDEGRMTISLVSKYLFGKVEGLSSKQINIIRDFLIKHKEYVKAYIELTADYLVSSGGAAVAIAPNSLMWKVMRYDENVSFSFPMEGGFMLIDSALVSSKTKKDDYIYSFLNFLYDREIMKYHFEKYGSFPSDFSVIYEAAEKHPRLSETIPTKEDFDKVEFFKIDIDDKDLDDIWIPLMA